MRTLLHHHTRPGDGLAQSRSCFLLSEVFFPEFEEMQFIPFLPEQEGDLIFLDAVAFSEAGLGGRSFTDKIMTEDPSDQVLGADAISFHEVRFHVTAPAALLRPFLVSH
jgi:hypothetical protein